VEATVTRIASSTALDDVLAKYSDILNSDTPAAGVITDEDVMAAVEVQAKAEQTRNNLDSMLRNLKAAAGEFATESTEQAVADATEVLQALLDQNPPLKPVASLLEGVSTTKTEPARPTPVVDRVPTRQVVIEPAIIEIPEYVAPEATSASETDGAAPAVAFSIPTAIPSAQPLATAGSEPSPQAAHLDDEPQIPIETQVESQVAHQIETEPPSKGSLLANLVDGALRPLDLPSIFQGEPKRLSPQEHVEALRAAKAENAARVSATMAGRAPGTRPPSGTSHTTQTPATPHVAAPQSQTQPLPESTSSVPKVDIATSAQTTASPSTSESPASRPTAAQGTARATGNLPPRKTSAQEAPTAPGLDPSSLATNSETSVTSEDLEIDKIIEAAADRIGTRNQSFWDEEDADQDVMQDSSPTAAMPTVPPAPSATKQDEAPLHDRSARAHSDRVDENVFAQSASTTTYLLSDQTPKDNSLELVIMRDEIRDLRDRLDSSQKLIEDLMLRLANLTEIALQNRQN
jgi:hypothetical protein